MDDLQRYLDPATVSRVGNLELQARLVVEGYLSGLHRSPYHGFSVEFAEHREYVPGDDIRHVDWKVYGRTGRYYLKQYEEETNLICWLLLDVSESMGYGSTAIRKYDYACLVAAALGYLVLHQQDSVGLATFDDQVRAVVRPSGQSSHLRQLVKVMSGGPARQKTHLAPIFHDLAERIDRRALILVLSDLFDEPAEILAGLRHLRHERHEVVVFHILDRAELDFPFEEATLFRGLEQFPELLTDPRALRQGYLAEVEGFLGELRRGCGERDVDYVLLPTDADLGVALASYLARRRTRAR
jgi:uncharacterized protein (DUF58 family)